MKKILLSIFIIIWLLSYKPFVLSFFIKDSNIKAVYKLSDNIFLEDKNLNENIIIYKSEKNISDYSLHSTCDIESEFLKNKNNYYFFSLKYLNSNCNDWNVYLRNSDKQVILSSETKLNILSKAKLFEKFIDYPNYYLNKLNNSLENTKNKYSLYSKLKKDSNTSLKLLEKNRKFLELEATKNNIEYILGKREEKYLIPVAGYSLPTRRDKIPDSNRPYRANYTDGIHHSWDIDAPFGEEVIALDDWIIVRVVNNWEWQDFTKLQYWDLSKEQKRDNLDILRWNQIWLKTSKWDVVFYWHLNEVYKDIKVWDFIEAWTKMWTIWKTWVPDKSYDDYHLDFSIQRNPYDVTKAWEYSLEDYMTWNRYFKWADREFILNNQYDIFEENLVVKK